MKKILLTSLALTASVLASPYSCDPHQEECSTEGVVIADQTTVNEVVTSTSRMDLANDSSKTAVVGGEYIHTGDIKIVNIPMGYNITQNIGLEASVPFVSVSDYPLWDAASSSFIGQDNMGLGDISIGANYHFGSYESDYGLNVTTFRYKTSTGDETKGLGLGKDAYTLSHNIAKEMGFARVHGLLAYTLNDDTVLGDSLTAMVGFSRPCLLSDKVRTNMKLTYYNLENTIRDDGFLNTPEYKKIDFWLEFNSDRLISGIPIGAGIKIPIVDEVTTMLWDGTSKTLDGSKTVLFYLSVGSFFD